MQLRVLVLVDEALGSRVNGSKNGCASRQTKHDVIFIVAPSICNLQRNSWMNCAVTCLGTDGLAAPVDPIFHTTGSKSILDEREWIQMISDQGGGQC
jgi:hypothetical protein